MHLLSRKRVEARVGTGQIRADRVRRRLAPDPAVTSLARSHGWPLAGGLFAAGVVAILVVYHETAWSFVTVWRGSNTYLRCFFILPITAWLVWRRREELALLAPRPWLPGWVLLGAAGLLWVVADAAGVLAYAQLGVASMIPALALSLFGTRVARVILFPLGFFFLAMPFGDALHLPLMKFTAHSSVAALRLTGVPVWIDGFYIATPTGRWEVVEACSGVRFLLSMFTLGCLFAYLQFRRPSTRILFGALSIAMPIVGNGLRVYVLILTGYLAGMETGVALDPTLGWAVFAVVLALFFLLGLRWREAPSAPRAAVADRSAVPVPRHFMGAAGATALALLMAPALFGLWTRASVADTRVSLSAPQPREGWMLDAKPPTGWTPGYSGDVARVRQTYARGAETVDCLIGYYRNQRQGAELIHFRNRIVPSDDPTWRTVAIRGGRVTMPAGPLDVHETEVRSASERYLVWHWYWLPDVFIASRPRAKLLQARLRIFERRDDASVVILSAPYLEDVEGARARLASFVRAMLPSIHERLRAAEGAPQP